MTGSSTIYLEKEFFGTHGAIGGVPQPSSDVNSKGFVIEDIPNPPTIGYKTHLLNVAIEKLENKGTKVTSAQNTKAVGDVWQWMLVHVNKHIQGPRDVIDRSNYA